MRNLILLLLLIMILSCCSCSLFNGFKPHSLVAAPNKTVLIKEVKGEYVLISLFYEKENSWVEYGWVKMRRYEGWQITTKSIK